MSQNEVMIGIGGLAFFYSISALIFFIFTFIEKKLLFKQCEFSLIPPKNAFYMARLGKNNRIQKEYFSHSLQRITPHSITSFSDYIPLFTNESATLKESYEKLIHEHCAFTILLYLQQEEEISTFECSGNIISLFFGRKYVVIFFRDITELYKPVKQLIAKNESLKKRFFQYSNLVSNAPFPMWLRGPDLSIQYCNVAYSRIVEEGNEAHPEYEMMELGKEGRASALQMKKKQEAFTERRHVVMGGKRELYHVNEIPLNCEEGYAGYAINITTQEVIEEELQRYKIVQSELLESSSNATAIYGPDMRLAFFNEAFVSFWKMSEVWLGTKPTYGEILEVMREKRMLPEQANFTSFKKHQLQLFTHIIDTYDDFFHLPDGRTLRVIVVPHALGGLLFTYEDITNYLALESSYHTLMEVQKATLDNLHEAIAVYGADGKLRLSNPPFATMWDLDPAWLKLSPHISEIKEKIKKLLHYGDNWEEFKNDIVTLATVNRTKHSDHYERTDGKFLHRILIPLPDGAALVSYLDVTDSVLVEKSLRERNEALEEADHLKTEFLANVSYELRTPLTSIIGFSEIILREYFGSLAPRQKDHLESIYQSSQYLMGLIDDILDLACVEAGYMKLDIESINIYDMLVSFIPLIEERLKKHRLDFHIQCSSTIGFLKGDEQRMKQIIFKLLSNAIKFTKPGGTVILGAEALEDNKICIWIEDTGLGIEERELYKLLQSYYTMNSSHKINNSGAGLGLAVVKNLIDLHGGSVKLHSIMGKGTKVETFFSRHFNEKPALATTQEIPAL